MAEKGKKKGRRGGEGPARGGSDWGVAGTRARFRDGVVVAGTGARRGWVHVAGTARRGRNRGGWQGSGREAPTGGSAWDDGGVARAAVRQRGGHMPSTHQRLTRALRRLTKASGRTKQRRNRLQLTGGVASGGRGGPVNQSIPQVEAQTKAHRRARHTHKRDNQAPGTQHSDLQKYSHCAHRAFTNKYNSRM